MTLNVLTETWCHKATQTQTLKYLYHSNSWALLSGHHLVRVSLCTEYVWVPCAAQINIDFGHLAIRYSHKQTTK